MRVEAAKLTAAEMTTSALNMKIMSIEMNLFNIQKENKQQKAPHVRPAMVLGGCGTEHSTGWGLRAGKEGVIPAGACLWARPLPSLTYSKQPPGKVVGHPIQSQG